jgi:hypothetical protein
MRRLTTSPAPLTATRAATPPHDPAAPGVYRNTLGHVVGVR